MTESKKTIAYITVAVVLAAIAWLTTPGQLRTGRSDDQGSPFFPNFTDPNAATSIEIISFDPASGTATPFKVEFKNDRWIIPSHHDYPADAKDRLAKTAAGVIDIKRDEFRSDNKADYQQLGVIDPLDDKVSGLAGRGTHVTLRGAGESVLADFIVGNPVAGKSGYRFVRVPSEQRVFAARIDVDLSANFEDWINRDLFEIDRSDITRIVINDYSINERTGGMEPHDNFSLDNKDGKWKLARAGASQSPDSAKVMQLLTALDDLKIVGVRPKPDALVQALQGRAQTQISQTELLSLQSKGFYISRAGQLLSNDGELAVFLKDGVEFLLRFGEVLYGSGSAVTAGTEDSTASAQRSGSTNRYLFVTAQFEPALAREPKRPSNDDWRTKPDSLMSATDKQNKSLGMAHDAWQRSAANGRQLATDLNARFSNWYYVIPEESYEKVKVKRTDLMAKATSPAK
ncbi:MAG: DUF4340 domain-containing protein [Candidatus Zixiibacteriota bacterium]